MLQEEAQVIAERSEINCFAASRSMDVLNPSNASTISAIWQWRTTKEPHSINREETGASEGLWDHFRCFQAPSFALVNSASQSNATGFENVKNDMFIIFRLPKRSHNPSLVPISS